MGKAKILSGLGDGQYKIQVLESRQRAESAKGQAESRITENRTAITLLESDIQAAQAEVDRLAGEQSDAIDRFQSGESGLEISDLSKYAEAIAKAAGARDKIRIRKKTKERMIEADQSLIGKVDALPPLREIQAWCADYTDDLSGEVATAEVPGEIGQVIIKPGFEGANQWSPQTDGMIQPALSSTPAGTFYNLAMLPGWQMWRPTFRTATLTSVNTNNDTGSISLDSATSSQQGLGVNDQTIFSDVPIEYMDCNSGAFESGDKVLVSFAGSTNGPTVVGFKQEPKVCCQPEIIAQGPTTGTIWDAGLQYNGTPVSGGSSAVWRIYDPAEDYTLFSGSAAPSPNPGGGWVLDGIPDEVDLSDRSVWLRKIVSSTSVTVTESDRSGDYWTTVVPPPDEEYAGGRFGIHLSRRPPATLDTDGSLEKPAPLSPRVPYPYGSNCVGRIKEDGTPEFTTPGSYPAPDGAIYHDDWITGDTYYATLVYWRRPTYSPRLEKGCDSGSGERWPQ